MGERFRLRAAVHLFLLWGEEVLLLRRFNTDAEAATCLPGACGLPLPRTDLKERCIRPRVRDTPECVTGRTRQ
jgi:hypothetical protein